MPIRSLYRPVNRNSRFLLYEIHDPDHWNVKHYYTELNHSDPPGPGRSLLMGEPVSGA